MPNTDKSLAFKSIAFVSPSFPPLPGGISDYASRLSSALARFCEVDVITTQGLGGEGNPSLTVHSAVTRWTWRGVPKLLRILGHVRPDLILLQDGKEQSAHPYLLMFLPVIIRLLTRCPVFLIVHEVEGERQQVQARLSSGVIVVEQEYVERFAKVNRRVECIHIGSNIPRGTVDSGARRNIRQRLGVDSAEIAVGFFGFISPRKGFDILLEALAILAMRERVCLVVLGGPVAGREFPDSFPIYWAGYRPAEEVAAILASMDVNAFPFPAGAHWRYGSLLAALMQDVPVVTTPGLRQALPGVFECLPNDPSDLADKLLAAAHAGQPGERDIPSWESAAMKVIKFAGKIGAA